MIFCIFTGIATGKGKTTPAAIKKVRIIFIVSTYLVFLQQ